MIRPQLGQKNSFPGDLACWHWLAVREDPQIEQECSTSFETAILFFEDLKD